MFYVIEINYVGPNARAAQYIDADRIEISRVPARTNSSNEERTEGWCGTTNDWSVYARGEYETIEAARAKVEELCGGEFREGCTDLDEDIVESYLPGKFEPLCADAVEDFCFSGYSLDVDVDTTDERLAEIEAEYEAAANAEGFTLGGILDLLEGHRQELRDNLADET